MRSLFEYLENVYQNPLSFSSLESKAYIIVKSNKFKDLIDDEKKCIDLIYSILEFPDQKFPNTTFLNSYRASHIIITWLLGVGLGNQFNLFPKTEGFHKLFGQKLWLQSAIVHDYGYFCQESNKALPIEMLTMPYDLLTDDYLYDSELSCLNNLSLTAECKDSFSYTYDEIKKYYKYSQSYHQKNINNYDGELSDHGITGGCLAFNKYCSYINKIKVNINYGPSPVITKIQKISCIIAASHNIFKSNSVTSDIQYQNAGLNNLLSTSPIRVTRKNYLLLLLSLVDTIECTKRFSKKSNPKEYLIQSTILKSINIEADDLEIRINFDELNKHIQSRKSKEMSAKLQNHINAICSIDSWTDFTAQKSSKNENLITVKLK